MAQIRLVEGDHADLAAAVDGGRAESTVPPLLLGRKDWNTMFHTELAATMLKVPTALVAHDQSASRTDEGQGIGTQTATA
jgi:hypothetical protein